MSPRPDDDAFTWEGDDDPTLRVSPEQDVAAAADPAPVPGPAEPAPAPAPAAPVLPEGFTAVGRGSESVGRPGATSGAGAGDGVPATADDEAPPMGNAALVGLGVLGGIYLLYVIGWIVGGIRLRVWVVSDAMFYASWWLAILAPVVWFLTVYVLTARSRPWLRFVWLGVGAVLLIPWPFLTVGPVAS